MSIPENISEIRSEFVANLIKSGKYIPETNGEKQSQGHYVIAEPELLKEFEDDFCFGFSQGSRQTEAGNEIIFWLEDLNEKAQREVDALVVILLATKFNTTPDEVRSNLEAKQKRVDDRLSAILGTNSGVTAKKSQSFNIEA